ncbi:transglutaminase-like domain-containing protein [Frondihabitans cladoniiphilus]|uniref:Transglutaminase-like domain-containing protein n=1 Tax=Frondihabitans cladoniiphilus TaxID=715785 RepID=A0ABP8VLK3_9MICO
MPRLPDLGFAGVLLAIAAVPLGAVYEHPAFVAVSVGALVLGGAIGVVGAWRRLPWYAVVALTAVVYLIVGVPLAVPTEAASRVLPTATGFRDLVTGTATSWQRMLSVDLPLGDFQALLVPALVVLLVATVVSVSLVLRTSRPGWAIAPAVGVLAFGIAVGGTRAVAPLVAGLAFVVVAPLVAGLAFVVVALLWAVRPVIADGRSFARGAAAAMLVLVCAAAGGLVVAGNPPAVSRQVLRTAVVPPFDPSHQVSPLVGFRNDVLPPGDAKRMLTVTGLPTGARVRVATLDDYDGLVFAVGDGAASASSGTFALVPSRIDRSRASGSRSSGLPATVSVTVDAYRGVWLPTVGDVESVTIGPPVSGSAAARPGAVDGTVYVNKETSTAAVRAGMTAGETYQVAAVVPSTPSLDQVAALRPGTAKQTKPAAVPAALAAVVKAHATGSTPGARLAAVTTWLRSGYVSDSGQGEPFSAAGHTAGRLQTLLTATPMLGDAEQYAPALALLARQLGFPSRVVVGFAGTGASGSQGTTTFTGADLTAWVEVQTSTGAWVDIDPNPKPRPVPSPQTEETQSVARPQTVLPPPPPSKNDTAVTQNRDGQKTKQDSGAPAWLLVLLEVLRIGLPILVIAAIVLAPLWAIALARLLRRRIRRRRDRAETTVSGAWNELEDAVHDSGPRLAAALHRASTRSEVAAAVGTPEVVRLAERAERSVFSRQVLTAAEVEAFWAETRDARRSIQATAPTRWERLRYHLTARSLVDGLTRWRLGRRAARQERRENR